jgi:hypothetical protein
MYDASTLLQGLPTTSNPLGTDTVNLDALPPFQLQLDQFLWAIHCDRLLWSTTIGSDMDRQAFQRYLQHGEQCYPAGLCHSNAPSSRQAFFGYLLTPEVQWPANDLTENFRQLNKDGEVPNENLVFDPMEIVIMPNCSFTPIRMEKRAVTDWSAYADLLVRQSQNAVKAAVDIPMPSPIPVQGPPPTEQSVTPSPTAVVQTLGYANNCRRLARPYSQWSNNRCTMWTRVW